MPHSPIPSSSDRRLATLLGLALAATAAGCSDDAACGPGDAPTAGVTLTVAGETITYGGFVASMNNDCTIAGSGVISVTIHGSQSDATQALTLCLPRPDLLTATPVDLVRDPTPPLADDRAQVVDVSANLAGGCTVAKDPAGTPTGTATFVGYCADGYDPAGYAIAFAGEVPLVRTCGAIEAQVTGTLGGRVSVIPPPPPTPR